MKKYFLLASMLFCMSNIFVSCSDNDDTTISSSTISVSIIPAGIENAKISNATVTLKNLTTGKEETITKDGEITDGKFSLNVIDGIYNFSFEADIEFIKNSETENTKIRASKENIEFVGGQMNLDLKDLIYFYQIDAPSSLVISEIYFTGSETPEGKQYNGDKYFKIYNNSNDILYADGMAIAETTLQTINNYKEYKETSSEKDDRNEKTPIQAIYRIPGTGKEHPIEPGKFLLICDNAINHKDANSNSIDLSNADFEWFDESTNPNYLDIDNPNVPNLDRVYCYTATIWGPHNRGFNSYLLVNLGNDNQFNKESFIENNKYEFSYLLTFATGSTTTKRKTYYIDNNKIIDAVNLSVKSEFQAINISKSLDKGWTYCGTVDQDKTRYGKCVRRKILSGHTLKDTNDSSVDFLTEQTVDPNYSFK